MEDRSQIFYAANDDQRSESLGITAMTVSPLRRFLAVAEKGEKAVC